MSSLQPSSTSSHRGLGTTPQVIMGLLSAEALAPSAGGGDAEGSADGVAGATKTGTSATEQPDAAPPLSAARQACADAEYELGDTLLVDDVDFHIRDLLMLGEFSPVGREVTAEVGDLGLRYTMTLQQFEEDQMPNDATNEQIAQRFIAVLDHLESNA